MSHDIYIPTPEKRLNSWDGPGPEIGISGWFRFVLKNRDGSVARDTGWFKNVITNVGMAHSVTYNDPTNQWASYLMLGAGVGAPGFTDTNLFGAQIGATNILTHQVSGFTTTYFYGRYKARWEVGDGIGTISEVAAVRLYFGTHFFSHALLVDAGGSPTTITKGADQSLDVYYELRNYPNMSDVNGTIDISGVSYDYTLRPYAFYSNVGSTWNINFLEKLSPSTVWHYAWTGKNLVAILTEDQNNGGGTNLGLGAFGVPYAKYSGPLPDFNTGPYYVDNYIEANIDYWNGTIDWVATRGACSSWQFVLNKTVGGAGLLKTNEERLRLHVRITLARH